MRFQALAPLLVASAASAYNSGPTYNSGSGSGFTPASTTSTDLLAANGLLNLAINQIQNAFQGKQQGSCTLANAAVRREW
jgi:tyrosinase